MPFISPELHSSSGIQEANEDKEWDADGTHHDAEVLEDMFGWHIRHAKNGSDERQRQEENGNLRTLQSF